jgi:hypothetical protein
MAGGETLDHRGGCDIDITGIGTSAWAGATDRLA